MQQQVRHTRPAPRKRMHHTHTRTHAHLVRRRDSADLKRSVSELEARNRAAVANYQASEAGLKGKLSAVTQEAAEVGGAPRPGRPPWDCLAPPGEPSGPHPGLPRAPLGCKLAELTRGPLRGLPACLRFAGLPGRSHLWGSMGISARHLGDSEASLQASRAPAGSRSLRAACHADLRAHWKRPAA